MTFKKRFLIGTTVLAFMLAACTSDETGEKEDISTNATETEQHDTHAHTVQEASDGTRIVISYEDGLIVANSKFEEIERFTNGPNAISLGNDQRHIFVKDQTKKDSYTLLDIGVWEESHGDHQHPYAENPLLADYEISGDQPAHIVNNAGQTAVFHDGSGKVEVYDRLTATQPITPTYTYEGEAHHGVAVPLSDGTLAVTYQTDSTAHLPAGVKIVDAQRKKVGEITNSCTSLHGTVVTGSNDEERLAFGCQGKIVTYNVASKETTDIALPQKTARVSTIKAHEESSFYLTNYKSEEDESLNTNVGIVNRQTNEFQLLDLKVTYGSALHVSSNNMGYVLAEDGYVYVIDLEQGKVIELVEVVLPFDVTAKSAKPSIVEVDGQIVVVDPLAKLLVQLHGDHAHVVMELDVEPISALAVTAF